MIEIDIDLDTGTNQVTVNGVAGAPYANLAGPGATVSRVNWRSDGAGFGHFIDAVPEPASMTLLSLGGLLVLSRRRHR